LGCLNLLTPDRVLAGAECVRKGAVFPLNLELHLPDPPLFGRPAFEHRVSDLGGVGHDEELHGWNTQGSSQWDGFRHISHPAYGYYDGVADADHGIDYWARKGIVGRAVLVDVARWRTATGRPIAVDTADAIEPEDLRSTLAAQGTQVAPGDILLVRTGWLEWYRSLDEEGRQAQASGPFQTCGLRPGRATVELLWDLHIAALAMDNPAVEVWPPGALLGEDEDHATLRADPNRMQDVFAHFALLGLLGLPLGELWDLDALAADCANDGIYDCLLTSAPLNLRSGVASPPNALAIK
jgi:kynurenine formamidase